MVARKTSIGSDDDKRFLARDLRVLINKTENKRSIYRLLEDFRSLSRCSAYRSTPRYSILIHRSERICNFSTMRKLTAASRPIMSGESFTPETVLCVAVESYLNTAASRLPSQPASAVSSPRASLDRLPSLFFPLPLHSVVRCTLFRRFHLKAADLRHNKTCAPTASGTGPHSDQL